MPSLKASRKLSSKIPREHYCALKVNVGTAMPSVNVAKLD